MTGSSGPQRVEHRIEDDRGDLDGVAGGRERELAQRAEQKRRLIWTGTYAKVTTV